MLGLIICVECSLQIVIAVKNTKAGKSHKLESARDSLHPHSNKWRLRWWVKPLSAYHQQFAGEERIGDCYAEGCLLLEHPFHLSVVTVIAEKVWHAGQRAIWVTELPGSRGNRARIEAGHKKGDWKDMKREFAHSLVSHDRSEWLYVVLYSLCRGMQKNTSNGSS